MALRPNFSRVMERAKLQAIHHRNKGRHVGASAAGWNVSRKLDRASYHDAARVALTEYQAAVRDGLQEYRQTMTYGPQWVELTTIPY